MKIAVLGAGGIGGYVGGRLAEAGHDVTLVARGRHLAAMRERGLRIESPLGDARLDRVKATDDIAGIGPVDVVLVAVKMPDLEAVAREIPRLVTAETRVVTLQNGIDAKPMIGRHVDPAIIAQGVIYLAAYLKEPGVIMTPGGKHQMLVDRLDGDSTMAGFFDAIDGAVALDVTRVDDADKVVWGKFTAQASISGVTSITRLTLGGVFASEEATGLLRTAFDEAVAVAEAKGVALDADHAVKTIPLYAKQPAAQSSSLLVDILAGKPTELEWLSGRIHQLGRELGVPTPAHSVFWAALAPHKDGPARSLG